MSDFDSGGYVPSPVTVILMIIALYAYGWIRQAIGDQDG